MTVDYGDKSQIENGLRHKEGQPTAAKKSFCFTDLANPLQLDVLLWREAIVW